MSNISIKILKLLAISVLVVGCKGLYGSESQNTATYTVEHADKVKKHTTPDTKTLQSEAAVVHNATRQAHTVQQTVPYTVNK